MSAHDASASDPQRLEELGSQLKELEQSSSQLIAAMHRSRQVRLGLALAVLVIVGASLAAFWSRAQAFVADPNPLVKELQAGLRANEKEIQNQGETFVKHSWPHVQKALTEQFTRDMPLYMDKLGAQREILANNVRDRLESQIRAQYKEAIAHHRQILEEEFPEVKDPEIMAAMVVNLQDSFEPMVKKYYADRVAAQFQIMYKIWDDFPLAEPAGPDDIPLADQLYGILFELMRLKLSELPDERDSAVSRSGAGGM